MTDRKVTIEQASKGEWDIEEDRIEELLDEGGFSVECELGTCELVRGRLCAWMHCLYWVIYKAARDYERLCAGRPDSRSEDNYIHRMKACSKAQEILEAMLWTGGVQTNSRSLSASLQWYLDRLEESLHVQSPESWVYSLAIRKALVAGKGKTVRICFEEAIEDCHPTSRIQAVIPEFFGAWPDKPEDQPL